MAAGDPQTNPNFYNRAIAAVERIAMKSLATGNFVWFAILSASIFAIWKLNSQDLKDVLLKVLATYGWLGYPVAGVTIFVSIKVLRWRENFYQQEMTRMAGVRNQLMQSKLELPLQSSVEKKDLKMKTLLFLCLLAFLIGAPLYLLYWNLFRAVLIQRLKYRLFKTRDELRLLLISGDVAEKGKAYPLVEKFCNRAILRIENVDFAQLLSHKMSTQAKLEVERDWEIIFNSGPDIRQHFNQIMFVIIGASAANSPGILLLMSPGFIFLVTALWFNKVKLFLLGLIKRGIGNLVFEPASC